MVDLITRIIPVTTILTTQGVDITVTRTGAQPRGEEALVPGTDNESNSEKVANDNCVCV